MGKKHSEAYRISKKAAKKARRDARLALGSSSSSSSSPLVPTPKTKAKGKGVEKAQKRARSPAPSDSPFESEDDYDSLEGPFSPSPAPRSGPITPQNKRKTPPKSAPPVLSHSSERTNSSSGSPVKRVKPTYELGEHNGIPCLPCVRSIVHGNAGVCRKVLNSGTQRCSTCVNGHSCTALPASLRLIGIQTHAVLSGPYSKTEKTKQRNVWRNAYANALAAGQVEPDEEVLELSSGDDEPAKKPRRRREDSDEDEDGAGEGSVKQVRDSLGRLYNLTLVSPAPSSRRSRR